MVGMLTGGMSAFLFAPPGAWIMGTFAGGIMNVAFYLKNSGMIHSAVGDIGAGTEYMAHVDEDTKRKHRLEEARIEGYTGEHI
eukprot:CAMPEP_0168317588 /NCGR_PEP_ID=MMETSP0210-20121227/26105_1 /TAXON_ID=40633 /ORGANISM="Condylostoma magnum, Strain COL2" /LENGTH=82 /DNA_ID=CAMNT_0008318323 /DNA_START=663 /DNA_END=911 /DNA_ORIENTATION=+